MEQKHPLAIRWFHWVNFPILTLMIWSGLMIYWGYDVYGLGPIHFFPKGFFESTGTARRLAEGMAWHFAIAWIFAINGILYVLYTALSGEWRFLLPKRASVAEAIQVTLYDLGLSKTHPPQRKFNGAQQIAYTSIILMGLGSLVTGLAIYKPVQFGWLTTLLGGYRAARLWHFLLTLGYAAFFVVHIAQVVRAGWANFQAMVTGHEEDTGVQRRRAFLFLGLGAVSGIGALQWVKTRRKEDLVAWPLRRGLEFNEGVWRDVYSPARLAPTFAREDAREPKINGDRGMENPLDASQWNLAVEGLASGEPLMLTLNDIRSLPRFEMVTELKCVEGWSEKVHWAGVRFADFAAKYKAALLDEDTNEPLPYVALETPDKEFHVGIEIESMLHPQVLLAYEMNGAPLTPEHGAPLRLVIPLKYGIKNIKRIGTIRYSDRRPPDYWAERGYDYYAGH